MFTDPASNDKIKFITKFLADSGATEHHTHSKIIFKTLDESNYGLIKCANKNSSANLKTEGVGNVEIKLENGNILKIDKVILAEALKENLLSLRKFADMGLGIYLDNKKIDIFDPHSNEVFLSGVYSRPYWLIELEINKSDECNGKMPQIINKYILANLASANTGDIKYVTRSVTAKRKLLDNEKEVHEMKSEPNVEIL